MHHLSGIKVRYISMEISVFLLVHRTILLRMSQETLAVQCADKSKVSFRRDPVHNL